MNLPLKLKFAFWLGMEINITDKNNQTVAFVKQKMWDFKEQTTIYSDSTKQSELMSIKANKILDWSCSYYIKQGGKDIGSVRRKGWKSLWKATYLIFDNNEQQLYKISEKNAFVKFADAFLAEIPVLGVLTGLLFNPVYEVTDMSGKLVFSIKKIPSFFSREFEFVDESSLTIDNPDLVLASCIQMLCLERNRG